MKKRLNANYEEDEKKRTKADEYKKMGNQEYAKKNFEFAIKLYD